jgi:hypothetical protein
MDACTRFSSRCKRDPSLRKSVNYFGPRDGPCRSRSSRSAISRRLSSSRTISRARSRFELLWPLRLARRPSPRRSFSSSSLHPSPLSVRGRDRLDMCSTSSRFSRPPASACPAFPLSDCVRRSRGKGVVIVLVLPTGAAFASRRCLYRWGSGLSVPMEWAADFVPDLSDKARTRRPAYMQCVHATTQAFRL